MYVMCCLCKSGRRRKRQVLSRVHGHMVNGGVQAGLNQHLTLLAQSVLDTAAECGLLHLPNGTSDQELLNWAFHSGILASARPVVHPDGRYHIMLQSSVAPLGVNRQGQLLSMPHGGNALEPIVIAHQYTGFLVDHDGTWSPGSCTC